MDTATPIGRAATGAVRKRSLGAGCTGQTNGGLTCGRRSCCASRSVANALGKADGSARRMWTTSSTTRETGKGSATETTWKAFATAATAAKQREKCTKIAGNQSAAERRRGGRLGRSGAMRERRAGLPCRPLPRVKKFARTLRKPPATLRERFFPHGGFRKITKLLRVPRPLADGHVFPPTPYPRNEGRGTRRCNAKQDATLLGPKDCA